MMGRFIWRCRGHTLVGVWRIKLRRNLRPTRTPPKLSSREAAGESRLHCGPGEGAMTETVSSRTKINYLWSGSRRDTGFSKRPESRQRQARDFEPREQRSA